MLGVHNDWRQVMGHTNESCYLARDGVRRASSRSAAPSTRTGAHQTQLATQPGGPTRQPAGGRGARQRRPVATTTSLLTALDEMGPASQADLSRRTTIDRSDMVAAVNELADQALWSEPLTPDRRRNVVTITTDGRRQLRKLDRLIDRVQDELLAPLSADERRLLIDLLTASRRPPHPELDEGPKSGTTRHCHAADPGARLNPSSREAVWVRIAASGGGATPASRRDLQRAIGGCGSVSCRR